MANEWASAKLLRDATGHIIPQVWDDVKKEFKPFTGLVIDDDSNNVYFPADYSSSGKQDILITSVANLEAILADIKDVGIKQITDPVILDGINLLATESTLDAIQTLVSSIDAKDVEAKVDAANALLLEVKTLIENKKDQVYGFANEYAKAVDIVDEWNSAYYTIVDNDTTVEGLTLYATTDSLLKFDDTATHEHFLPANTLITLPIQAKVFNIKATTAEATGKLYISAWK